MSIEIIDDHFMVCSDCLMIIANDDATGLDYSLSEEEATEREGEIREAISYIQYAEAQIAISDSNMDEEFSSKPCACCKTRLAGHRHHCLILAESSGKASEA